MTAFHHAAVVGPPQRVVEAIATDSLFKSLQQRTGFFFPVSASVVSKRILWLNKQRAMTTDDETAKASASEIPKHTCNYRLLP